MFPQSLNFQPINTEQYCTSGDVTIFPGAAIAPGVLLQADVGSRIVIRAGVCVGLGCVIHASHGTITINDGANLGAGVLLIGDVTIGARACLGTAVTIINSAVAARAILEPGTVVGDRSRRESIDDILSDIPMNSPNKPVLENSVSAVSNDLNHAGTIVSPDATSPVLAIEPSNPTTPASLSSAPTVTPLTIAPVVSTFKYPEEPNLEITTPGIVLDNSGQPWQTCDPNPWDPTNHPAGETTCQITSKPKEATPYNPTLFSSQTNASPYPPYPQPPYPQPPQLSTTTVSSFKYPEPIKYPEPLATPPEAAIAQPAISAELTPQPIAETIAEPGEPKAVYGQDYVNRMLGKLTGRS